MTFARSVLILFYFLYGASQTLRLQVEHWQERKKRVFGFKHMENPLPSGVTMEDSKQGPNPTPARSTGAMTTLQKPPVVRDAHAPSGVQKSGHSQLDRIGSHNQVSLVTPSILSLDQEGGLVQPEFQEHKDRMGMSVKLTNALRKMLSSGDFDSARMSLVLELKQNSSISPFAHAMGCNMLAELFNRWGSAAAQYSAGMMEAGVQYSLQSTEAFRSQLDAAYADVNSDDDHVLRLEHAMIDSYFWLALNLSTLAKLGGSTSIDMTSEKAMRVSWEVLGELRRTYETCRCRHAEETEVPECRGRMIFVEGILHFCTAEALKEGHLEETKDVTREQAMKLAKKHFHESYETLVNDVGEVHNDTTKSVTMIGVIEMIEGNKEEACRWLNQEFHLREMLVGRQHPRTVKTLKTYQSLFSQLDPDSDFVKNGQNSVMLERVPSHAGSEEGDTPGHDVACHSASFIDSCQIEWDMNPFELLDTTTVDAVMQMFESSGVSSCFEINQTKLARFVVKVKSSYDDSIQFHNWVHAFSVTHNAFLIMMDPAVVKRQEPLERLAILISCLCHDMYHPGVNNDFLIKSADPLTLKYPQVNCLEAFHLDSCKRLLKPGKKTDILEGCSDLERSTAMELIEAGIMATDMGVHKSIVEGLKARPAGEFDACNDQDKKDLLCAIVHAADLSGQTLPEGVAHKFGMAVLEEFAQQHRKEIQQQLSESAFMKDLHLPITQAKAQLGFLHYVVKPLWTNIARHFPSLQHRVDHVIAREEEIDFEQVENWKGLHHGLVEQGEFSQRKGTSIASREFSRETSGSVASACSIRSHLSHASATDQSQTSATENSVS